MEHKFNLKLRRVMDNPEVRDEKFAHEFTLSVILMSLAKIYLEAAAAACDSKVPKVKRALQLTAHNQQSKIHDVTLKLKGNSYNEIVRDLTGEEKQAIGNILHELCMATNLVEMEREILDFLKTKIIKHQ